MSVSDHPIALRLERRVGGATKLLATVMGLPLVDGIFPALVVAGALTTSSGALSVGGVLQTGLLIFGGSATVAVILAEMDGTPTEKATSVLLVGAAIVPIAMIEAAFAQTLYSLFDPAVFQRFAGLVILAIAAKTASAEVGTYLPGPGAIVGLGMIASFRGGAELTMNFELSTLLPAGAAAGTGVAFALGVALGAPTLQGAVDIDRFRFGSSVALGMLAVDVLGLLSTEQPVALGVLAVTALLSYDPDSDGEIGEGTTDAAGSGPTYSPDADSEDRPVDLPSDVSTDGNGHADEGTVSATDGGTGTEEPDDDETDDDPERPPYL